MKKFILSALMMLAVGAGFAQKKFEAKINPLGALFGMPDVSGEYIVSDSFGVELGLGIAFGDYSGISVYGLETPKQSGFGAKVAAKYYFSPDEGGDGWYGGIYLRQETLSVTFSQSNNSSDFKSSVFAGGVEFGKKWLFDSGLLIELGAGFGKPFTESRKFTNISSDYVGEIKLGVDFTGKFAVGYRF